MTLSLAKMLFTCDFTVPSLIKRAEPISFLLLPWAISLSTSISRSLNASPLTRWAFVPLSDELLRCLWNVGEVVEPGVGGQSFGRHSQVAIAHEDDRNTSCPCSGVVVLV